jgi:SAM-dependent methyltransferase
MIRTTVYFPKEMMIGTGEEFKYVECSDCGALQIVNVPSDISKYYPPEYYSFSSVFPSALHSASIKLRLREFVEQHRDKHALFSQDFLGRIASWKFPPNEKLHSMSGIGLTFDSKILDAGSGSGNLLQTLGRLGFKNLLGIDKYIREDMEFTDGLRIRKKDISEVEGTWDLIMFNHSFEHIPNQYETLRETSRRLGDYGICIINMPTVSSYAWKHYKTHWVQCDAPRHLLLHSVKSIRLLAEKAGLTLTKVLYNSNEFQFWGSEQYLKGISLCSKHSHFKNYRNSIFSQNQIVEFAQKDKRLNSQNQGDQAAFYLAKKD